MTVQCVGFETLIEVEDAMRAAMQQDVMRGVAIVLPKGTKVSVSECLDSICMVAVEGRIGYWIMVSPVIK